LEDEDWIIEILAEKAYNIFCEQLNLNLEYFEREKPDSFDIISKNVQNAWKAIVREIICCYPTMELENKNI
jgi:hypothetical protein